MGNSLWIAIFNGCGSQITRGYCQWIADSDGFTESPTIRPWIGTGCRCGQWEDLGVLTKRVPKLKQIWSVPQQLHFLEVWSILSPVLKQVTQWLTYLTFYVLHREFCVICSQMTKAFYVVHGLIPFAPVPVISSPPALLLQTWLRSPLFIFEGRKTSSMAATIWYI